MKYTCFRLFLVQLLTAAELFRLNTNEVARLNAGDALVSTLGYFKATLLSKNCTLAISSFSDNNTYVSAGNYSSPNVSGDCQYLTVVDGAVVTDSNQSYMRVGSGYNLSTILTIDDWGVIRLIGTYQLSNFKDQISNEMVVSDFQKNSTFVYPTSQLSVAPNDQFPTFLNARNWSFTAAMGLLTIGRSGSGSVNYQYITFLVNNSQITDINSKTFPSAIFTNISFTPRCVEPRLYLDFKPPFLFVADPYWPVFTLYEQGRYKILEFSLSQVFQPTANQDELRLFVRPEQSVCPLFTFQFKGDCITTCPSPYYHEMRGQFGYCVLTCEEYTPKNETTRICSCLDQYQIQAFPIGYIQSCPNNTVSYPYGCYCSGEGMFFDRSLSLSCVSGSNCPSGTFGSNGLCMDCPNDCITCQIDQTYRSYFECLVCAPSYTVINGQCVRSCSPGLGRSIVNGSCLPCADTNCTNCSQAVTICTACNILYTLQSGSCLQSCSNSSVIVPIGLQSICLVRASTCASSEGSHFGDSPFLKCIQCNSASLFKHLDSCVVACPQGFVANANNYCYCGNSSLTVNDKCLSLSVCPIEMGWSSTSSSCVSCAFGCLTCYDSACTSCNPGYFLYISPLIISCRRKSPLYSCDQQYGWIQKTCLVLGYNDPALGMDQCYADIANCMVCNRQSSGLCILCKAGFYNVNNSCIAACPNGSIPYNGQTCILTSILSCASPYLKLYSVAFTLRYSMFSASDSYGYYTFITGKQSANDPVGYIPSYQQLTQQKDDTYFRDSEFYHPAWTCLKCNDGFGLSSDFTACLPCPTGCKSCYLATNNSCLSWASNSTCLFYINSINGLCVQNCSSASLVPTTRNGILYCQQQPSDFQGQQYIKIDGAVFTASDGTNHVFFIFDQTIKNDNITIPVFKRSQRFVSGSAAYSSKTQSAPLQSGNYISIYDSTPGNQLYLVDLSNSLQQLVSTSNGVFPNTIYGVDTKLSHPQFMKTWLSFIGEVMSIVIIVLHVVFIGNDLLYKVDNTLILAQTIYYFSFVQLLVGNVLAQFYYGWIFAHFGFFPNFFQNLIPARYVEMGAPNAYKLATLDANVIRNGGFAFSLLLVFLWCFTIVTLGCWIIKVISGRSDVWYPSIAKNALLGGVEFISMAIFYWSVANLLYISGADSVDLDFYNASRGVSIAFIVVIVCYTVGRWLFNYIGGLYMSKRILIATILAAAYMNNSYLAPLIILETVFTILRYFIQRPERKAEIVYLIGEYLVYVFVYLLLFLCLNQGVNALIVSIVMFVIIVILGYDLTEVYLESQNEWFIYEDDDLADPLPKNKQVYYDHKKLRLAKPKQYAKQ